MNYLIGIAFVFVAVVGAAVAYGALRWRGATRALRARLEATREPIAPATVDLRGLDGLPAPVQRYFRKVLRAGQPVVTGVRLKHGGKFNIDESADRWKPFTSDQRVITQRRGFDWNGSVSMMPGLPVRVHDAFVGGEGSLHAAFLGLFSIAAIEGTREVATAQLMRYVAEAAWYPTALLPGQGVRWKGVDNRSALATLVDGEVALTMRFTFTDDDLIDTVRADARGRAVGGNVVPTPWEGRFWNYAERGGMLVPLEGEVGWILPGGPRPYWRGRITRVEYEFAG
jgi:hypothetical protein